MIDLDSQSDSVPSPRWLTVANAGRYLDLSAQTVRRMVHDRGLPASRVGAELRISVADLEAWLREHRAAGPDRSRATYHRRRQRARS